MRWRVDFGGTTKAFKIKKEAYAFAAAMVGATVAPEGKQRVRARYKRKRIRISEDVVADLMAIRTEWEDDFWQRVDRSGGPKSCWPWTLSLNKKGYGHFRKSPFMEARTHRVAYALDKGAAPGRLLVRHKCDYPRCCNPAHLELGTAADNSRDMVERGRHRKPAVRQVGDLCATTRVPDDGVRDIRRRWTPRSGMSQVLADEYGVAASTIVSIATGRHRRSTI